MRRCDFSYDLPLELIAQHPPQQRADGRLLCLDGSNGALRDSRIAEFPNLLRPGDLLVLNDTRVIPARVFGHKPTGGEVEILLERVLGAHRILAHVRSSKPLREDAPILLAGNTRATFVARADNLFELELDRDPIEFFEQYGAMPLPPYIERTAEDEDSERYQTIFARERGAVAAPTAGLHFDAALLDRCKAVGAGTTFVTLHVGAGTFSPVRVDELSEHRMHGEYVRVSSVACDAINAARERGGRVIAIGTTVMRSLESAAQSGELVPLEGETRLFITPGFQFRVVDALLTNFHLSESTLLMLVCAFGGYENVLRAYKHAVEQRYRFFSYGDAMFVQPSQSPQ